MPSIDIIELEFPSQKAKLVIHESDRDLQGKNKVTTISDDGILYKRNDSVERAAVHVATPDHTYLKVTVSGLTESQKKGRLLLLSETIEGLGCQIRGEWSPADQTENSDPDTAIIHCDSGDQKYQDRLPDVFRGQLNWKLHMVEDGEGHADREAPIDLGSTVLELYVLKHKLPKLFESDGAFKIPLLLLQMFLGAALEQKVQSHFEWVSLVTRISHGSAEPVSGNEKDTATHWLRYNTFSGAANFGDNAYGGKFMLNHWLAAYRIWKTNEIISCVNCYDQAAIVEVALSLGMDYNQIAWEYHQVFGYISRNTKLVGWGLCNNPYFCDDRKIMIVEDADESRWAFRNHAHLSWGPDFHPEKEENFYGKNKDPKNFTATPIYIIDACAGPHVGNELRDVYYKQLDNNSGDTKKYPVKKLDELKRDKDNFPISYWGSGLTGLSNESSKYSNRTLKDIQEKYYEGDSIKWSDLEPPLGSPLLTKVYGGKLSTIRDQFAKIVQIKTPQASDKWFEVEVRDEEDKNIIEWKMFEDTGIARSYFSLRVTVTPSHDAATELIKDRTMKFSLSSNEPIIKKQKSKSTIIMIGGTYLKLFTYANLMVEVASLDGWRYLQDIADEVAERLSGDEAKLAEPNQWEACLN